MRGSAQHQSADFCEYLWGIVWIITILCAHYPARHALRSKIELHKGYRINNSSDSLRYSISSTSSLGYTAAAISIRQSVDLHARIRNRHPRWYSSCVLCIMLAFCKTFVTCKLCGLCHIWWAGYKSLHLSRVSCLVAALFDLESRIFNYLHNTQRQPLDNPLPKSRFYLFVRSQLHKKIRQINSSPKSKTHLKQAYSLFAFTIKSSHNGLEFCNWKRRRERQESVV